MAKQPPLIDPFVVQLLEANSDALAYTTNKLLDAYKEQAETNQATLDAIRSHIDSLLSGPWMPTPDTLLRALWPTKELVDKYRKTD